jgi:hypothetical protein
MRSRSSNRQRALAFAASLAMATPASLGQAAPVHCPETLKLEQHAVDLPPGLRAFDSGGRHVWVNAQFSDGPPDEQAWLAPSDTQRRGKGFTNLWRFTRSARGIWLSCGYTGTSLLATFRLPDGVSRCEVRYDGTFSPPATTEVNCR